MTGSAEQSQAQLDGLHTCFKGLMRGLAKECLRGREAMFEANAMRVVAGGVIA